VLSCILFYVGDHLLGPILAALIGGPLVAISFRYFEIPKEVAEHDARASELVEDQRRWVRDRDRELETEIRAIVNGAGSQLYAGSLVNAVSAAMHAALHQYRDEATSQVREFSALARSEGRWHARHRGRRGFSPPALGLLGQERIALNRWRQRPHPVEPGSTQPDITAGDDPTSNEPNIEKLETDEGLTWAEAAARRTI
jgi:hypothetical protein